MPATMESISDTKMKSVNASERLIFALDVPTIAEAETLIRELEGVVSFFKIGIELYTGDGLNLIPRLTASGKNVFLDLKYFDVPETVERAVERVATLGVTFLTVHGNGNIVRAAVSGRKNTGLKLLSVTALTSLDNDDMKDLGFDCTIEDLVIRRATKALEAGCDGVITSPREAGKVRELAKTMKGMENKFLIVTPGVRPTNSPRDDHKRLSTPTEAIKEGADFLVMGRPIRDASSPRRAAELVISEMQAAFNSMSRRSLV
jgi:orotidine-5'-phosphate decarboxylase